MLILCVCVFQGGGDAQLEVVLLQGHAPFPALVPAVPTTEEVKAAREAPGSVEVRKSDPQFPLLQRPHQLGHGPRFHVRTRLLAGGQPDPLVWSGELTHMTRRTCGMNFRQR